MSTKRWQMAEVIWLSRAMVEAAHDNQILVTGGLPGVRDENLLESTLAKPQNLLTYGGDGIDWFDLAASYCWGFARNHCFNDGNKRAALSALLMFLGLNGYRLICESALLTQTILDVAAGQLTREALAIWLRQNTQPI